MLEIPYGTKRLKIQLPNSWKTMCASPRNLPSLKSDEIAEAIGNPIGCGTLSELSKGSKTAAIVVDDHTRPTPAYEIIPHLLKELADSGIREDNITIIAGLGGHRPMTEQEFELKVGRGVFKHVKVVNHDYTSNFVYYGKSKAGVPIWLNRTFAEADVKLGIGGLIPHVGAGYAAGAKIVLPGICSLETIRLNHELLSGKHLGNVENPLRHDIEDVARIIGIDFTVNVVMNLDLHACGVFAGDFLKAHRAGVKMAKEVYEVPIPEKADVTLVSAFPVDADLIQSAKALYHSIEATKAGGTIVLFTASPEGLGFHALYTYEYRNCRVFQEDLKKLAHMAEEREIIVCSDGVKEEDFHMSLSTRYSNEKVLSYYPEKIKLVWPPERVLKRISGRHRPDAKCIILPYGAITIPRCPV
jgi:nickel-dependent lactate racemase